MNLSRSVPSSMPTRPGFTPSASTGLRDFPICDDLTDDEDDVPSPPPTPTKEKLGKGIWKQSVFDDGPRTAPLASTFANSPFFSNPTSTPSSDRRKHVRYPSEGVFDMSMDESASSASDASEELKALMGLLPRRRIASAASTPVGLNKSASKEPGFFASSNFQNSPSPDDLPPPAFGF